MLPADDTPQAIESGPYLANAIGLYSREHGAERRWVVGICVLGVALIAAMPLALQQRMQCSLALVVGCAIGSVLATWWRRRHPLPLVLVDGKVLLCFAPTMRPKLLARFPIDAVSSVAMSPSPAGIELEWLFRGGEQGRFTLNPDPRLAIPLAFFLTRQFGPRFKDRS